MKKEKSLYFYAFFFWVFFLGLRDIPNLWAQQSKQPTLPFPEGDERNYYILNLLKKKPYFLNDTLFEKTVWRSKVSHILLEERAGKNRVTLLMMERYPYNYKSQNYPIYFEYENYKEAFDKLIALDKFLSASGVMRVKLNGAKIIDSRILFAGYTD